MATFGLGGGMGVGDVTNPGQWDYQEAKPKTAFKFNPFTEDLGDAQSDLFNNNRAGFLNYLLNRGGVNQSAYQRQFNRGNADWITALSPLLEAASGKNAAQIVGANTFGTALQELVRPFTTAGSMSGNALGQMRSLKGKGTGGTDIQETYLGDTNGVLGTLQAILAKRMGSYMASKLLGDDMMSRLSADYVTAQEAGGNKAPDIIEFLMQRGML